MIKIKNEGKKFEEDFKKSIPLYCWNKRLNDNAAIFSGGTNTRFTSNNECDYLVFDTMKRNLFCLELKSTLSNLTYWNDKFEDHTKKNFQIKKNQIIGLSRWNQFDHTYCGFIFNFRSKNNRTFFVNIENFNYYTDIMTKKSINLNDVINMNAIEIQNRLIRTRYKYDLTNFFENI